MDHIAIVLGGTLPHEQLIRRLKSRGYRVILIDWNKNPLAAPAADEHIRESTLDKEVVLDIARDRGAELVISSCVDQANSVCCYVAEKLGLPRPYSYETSLDVTDKGRMKNLFAQGGVTSSEYRVFDSPESLARVKLEYPVVVKPVDSNSSKGVRKADCYEEMMAFGTAALEISRCGRGIVEGYCPGVEIQVDCVAVGGKACVLMTRSKATLSQGSTELNSCGSMVPAGLTEGEESQATGIAQRICDAFGLRDTPFFYQARLNDGVISVLEFAPRIGGGLSFEMIERATGVDIIDVSIASFLGEPLSLDGRFVETKNLATLLLYMEEGVFGQVVGMDELKKDGIVDYAAVLRRRGARIGPERTSGNRIATLIMSAGSKEELEGKAKFALDNIDILDINGIRRMVR